MLSWWDRAELRHCDMSCYACKQSLITPNKKLVLPNYAAQILALFYFQGTALGWAMRKLIPSPGTVLCQIWCLCTTTGQLSLFTRNPDRNRQGIVGGSKAPTAHWESLVLHPFSYHLFKSTAYQPAHEAKMTVQYSPMTLCKVRWTLSVVT